MELPGIFGATGAHFIGSPLYRLSELGDPAILFRRAFDVSGAAPVQQAVLHVTALGVVEASINGTRTDDHVLEPSWTSYRHRLTYRSHDVTALIQPGENVLGAVVGEGWATGRLAAYENNRRVFADRIALLAVLELQYADGRVEYIPTDTRFLTSTGEVRFNGIYDGTTIDFPLAQPGWDQPGFSADVAAVAATDADAADATLVAADGVVADASSDAAGATAADAGMSVGAKWLPAELVDWEPGIIEPANAQPIREIETLPPQQIWWGEGGSVYVDFGQNISGWVRLRHRGKPGDTVTIRHAEVVVNGKPDYETLREAKATDTYILADDAQILEPRLTFHGFRYAEIIGLKELPSPEDIQAVVIHSDMPRTGWFHSSNPTLNRLHENILWGMRDNFVGIPTDCPQRDERLGWTGDINAFSPAAVLLYDVREVLGSWLKDLLLEHQARGLVSHYVPSLNLAHTDWTGAQSPPTALWSDTAVRLPWKMYWQYGDPAILAHQYWSMTTFVEQVAGMLDKFGLWTSGFQYGDWLDPDAPPIRPGFGKTDKYLVANAFFTKVVAELADAARVLGHSEDAARYTELAGRMRDSFRTAYMPRPGRLTQETTAGYAIAIECGLFDDDELATAGERLVSLVRANGHRIDTGFAGTPHVAPALTRTGYTDDAYQLLLQPEIPGFVYPISMGATTIWERWDSVMPDGSINHTGMTSLNHYAYGAVASWLYHTVGGLAATSPGWATIRVAPEPGGGLTHAHVKHLTPLGLAEVKWELADAAGGDGGLSGASGGDGGLSGARGVDDGSCGANGGSSSARQMRLHVVIPDGAQAEVHLPLHPESPVLQVGAGTHTWEYEIALPSVELVETTADFRKQ